MTKICPNCKTLCMKSQTHCICGHKFETTPVNYANNKSIAYDVNTKD